MAPSGPNPVQQDGPRGLLDSRVRGNDKPPSRTPTSNARGDSIMRYAVVIEKVINNYSAYVPDLPGCIATGETIAEAERELREAIRFHIEGLDEDGLPIPPPSAVAEYVET
jgi:predicted RNase H-like HicB family nuclease